MTTRNPLALALALASGMALSSAALAAGLPLKSITLYRSGVGYFQRLGVVTGDETIHLRFEADRINDILKSMVMLDYDGGRVVGAEYQPNRPLAQRLKDFRINPLRANNIVDLMAQLQGVPVRLKTPGGEVTGVVLGVENRPTPIGAGEGAKVVQDHAVTLVTDSGVTTVSQSQIRSFDILDEDLAAEFSRALETIAQNRNDRWTTIDLSFAGVGKRNVAVAYTTEAPVWKTSYRLILPAGTDAEPTLQGWAIVENDTNDDWQDVHLSLASGRPVSFVMDLQTPLMLDRPNVPVPVIGGIGPIIYQQSKGRNNPVSKDERKAAPDLDMAQLRFQTTRNQALQGVANSLAPFTTASRTFAQSDRAFQPAAALVGVDANRFERFSNMAQAVTGDVGEQFMYTIDAPVSIERGKSSMLPILSKPIAGRRMTIYSYTGADSHPMLGVELTNDTGLHLMPGPIAVYDAGAYAGDAEIMHIARGQRRLLSFAIDHDVEVSREQSVRNDVRKISIIGGLIVKTHSSRQTTTYTLTNNDTDGRLALIEHAKIKGWKILGDEKPNDETETLYRFEAPLPAGETKKLAVKTERVWSQSISINNNANLEYFLANIKNGQASPAVMDAITTAANMQSHINSLQKNIVSLDTEKDSIAREQGRIRANMKSVNRSSGLYSRYMKKLDTQETRLEDIHDQRADLQRQLDKAQQELRVYLKDLNVD